MRHAEHNKQSEAFDCDCANLLYSHKARIQGRYVLEMEIYRVAHSSKYKEGVRYGLILHDLETGRRVLMDNHHPKGPHIHLDDKEMPYDYINEDKLISDFKNLVAIHMEVTL